MYGTVWKCMLGEIQMVYPHLTQCSIPAEDINDGKIFRDHEKRASKRDHSGYMLLARKCKNTVLLEAGIIIDGSPERGDNNLVGFFSRPERRQMIRELIYSRHTTSQGHMESWWSYQSSNCYFAFLDFEEAMDSPSCGSRLFFLISFPQPTKANESTYFAAPFSCAMSYSSLHLFLIPKKGNKTALMSS